MYAFIITESQNIADIQKRELYKLIVAFDI